MESSPGAQRPGGDEQAEERAILQTPRVMRGNRAAQAPSFGWGDSGISVTTLLPESRLQTRIPLRGLCVKALILRNGFGTAEVFFRRARD